MNGRLYLAELKRSWLELKRYPLATIGEIVVLTVMFYGLFLGASYLSSGAEFGQRLEDTVVGYAAFVLLMATLTTLTWEIQREALTGTLEQLLLTPYGLSHVLLHRALARVAINIVSTALIVGILAALMQVNLILHVSIVVPIGIALVGAYGLGLIMAALALVFKRVDQVTQILQFALMFLLIAPLETLPGLKAVSVIIPMAPAVGILRDIMVRGQGLEIGSLGLALTNVAIYLTIGIIVFKRALTIAKSRGIVSGY